MIESLGDVKRAVERYFPKREWIYLEGEEADPVKSLACHLNTKWSHLESLLGEVKNPKHAIQDILGKSAVPLIRPDRSENVRNGFRYFAIGVDRANDFVMLSATKAAKWMPSNDPSFVAASENEPMCSRAIAMVDSAIGGLHAVGHKAHIYGCWHMAASARAMRDAAAELGIDVHDCSNRDKYQKGLSTPA